MRRDLAVSLSLGTTAGVVAGLLLAAWLLFGRWP